MKINIGKYTLEITFGLTQTEPQAPYWAAEYSEYIKTGQFLSAIKFYKDSTGSGLKEAKDFSDKVRDYYNATKTIKLDW